MVTSLRPTSGLNAASTQTSVTGGTGATGGSGSIGPTGTAPPVIEGILTASGTIITSATATAAGHSFALFGTGATGDMVTLSLGNGTVLGSVTVPSTGTWSIGTGALSLPDGLYILNATQSPATAAAVSAAVSALITLDNHIPVPPAITAISPDSGPIGDSVTNAAVPITLSGTAEANALVTVFQAGTTVIGAVMATPGGLWSLTLGGPLPSGTTSFTATATDAAAATSAPSTAYAITTDTHTPPAPTITGITPDTGVSATDGITQANTITVKGTGEANDAVTITAGAIAVASTVNAQGQFAIALPVLGDGSISLTATVTDLAGTASPASQPTTVTVAASAATLGTPLITPGGAFYIGTAAALLAAARPIAGPAGLFNTLVIQGDGTITDAAFAGISNVKAITLNGTATESLSLSANAAAMAGAFLAVSTPNAANYSIDDSAAGAAPLYLLGGSGNATVSGSNGGDYLIFSGGVVHLTEGSGSNFINLAANQLNLTGMSITGGSGYNRLVMAGSNTLTDSSFAGVSHIQELDFSAGAQSIILGADAHAAFGTSLTIYAAGASALLVNAAALVGVALTVADTGTGNDTLIAGTGGSYLTGGSGAEIFEVGLGGTNYITDFVPGLDRITLQAGGFTSLAQVTAATAQFGASGFDIAIGNGAHVVVLGVSYTAVQAKDFGLAS